MQGKLSLIHFTNAQVILSWIECILNEVLFIQRLIYEASLYTQLTWLHGEARSVPQGAVIGSYTRDGAPLYIIMGDNRPGNYEARNSFAEYEASGAKSTANFKYLVLYFCAYLLFVGFAMYKINKGIPDNWIYEKININYIEAPIWYFSCSHYPINIIYIDFTLLTSFHYSNTCASRGTLPLVWCSKPTPSQQKLLPDTTRKHPGWLKEWDVRFGACTRTSDITSHLRLSTVYH